MLITIDSNQFVFGISGESIASEQLLMLIPQLEVVIPRIVLNEVTRNLQRDGLRKFYNLLNNAPSIVIIDDFIPRQLLDKYVDLGLREKGDAFIGAFAEWQKVDILISDNRHFLVELQGTPFDVMKPEQFLDLYHEDNVK